MIDKTDQIPPLGGALADPVAFGITKALEEIFPPIDGPADTVLGVQGHPKAVGDGEQASE